MIDRRTTLAATEAGAALAFGTPPEPALPDPRPAPPMIRMQRTGCLLSIVASIVLTIALNVCIRMF